LGPAYHARVGTHADFLPLGEELVRPFLRHPRTLSEHRFDLVREGCLLGLHILAQVGHSGVVHERGELGHGLAVGAEGWKEMSYEFTVCLVLC
jgi:hypothetical protein